MSLSPEQIEEVKKIATDQLDALIPNHLPIGTIISSLINYDKFRDIVNDPLGFNPNRSRWSPADGRGVTGSKYSSYLQVTSVPDLRGLFIRGLNRFDENETTHVSADQKDVDGAERKSGSFQKDGFEKHSHQYNESQGGSNKVLYSPTSDAGTRANGRMVSTTEQGTASETRPKNAAVYYYIKIN